MTMKPTAMNRRQLLLAGTALVLTAPALLRSDLGARMPNALERLAAQPGARIPLLYVEADPLASLAAAAGSPVVAATALRSGDRALEGRAIVVDVAGFTEGGPGRTTTSSLDALVLSTEGPDEPLPFYAFTHRPGATSAPVRLATRATAAPSLGLTVDVDRATATTVFTTRRAPGLARLRPGWYLVDLRPGGGPVPDRLPATGDPVWAQFPSLALSVAAA